MIQKANSIVRSIVDQQARRSARKEDQGLLKLRGIELGYIALEREVNCQTASFRSSRPVERLLEAATASMMDVWFKGLVPRFRWEE